MALTLNSLISGNFNPGDLVVIAGRPGMGKTSFSWNIAEEWGKHNKGKRVAAFNLNDIVNSIDDIRETLSNVKNIGFVIVDYLNLIENDSQDFGEIAHRLKLTAEDFNVPVVLVSQVSPDCENRENKRPLLADLQCFGSIEEYANTVIFLYREAYYNPDCDDPHVAECIVAKNRSGYEAGTVYLNWSMPYARFNSPVLFPVDEENNDD
jgi:replicative DNA helicase